MAPMHQKHRLLVPDTVSGYETCVVAPLGPEHTQSLATLFSCPKDRAWLFPQSSYLPSADIAAKRWRDHSATTAIDVLSYVENASSPIAVMRMRDGEIAYFVTAAHRKRGVASRALATLYTVAQNGPETQLTANVQRENMASRNVLEKSGFRFDGLVSASGHCGAMLKYTRLLS